MKLKYSFFPLLILIISCSESKKISSTAQGEQTGIGTQGKLFASLFQQRAAEYHALCLQAYNIARLRLDESFQHSSSAKPKAIITDLDETVLNNSPAEIHQDLQEKGFDNTEWNKWTAKGEADTLPGSFSFFKYAASKNVEIFYISNRDENDRAGTLQNLQRFGFPNADNAHLLLRQNTSGKEVRRQQVIATHDVILLLGDNLSDFTDLFDKKTVNQRLTTVQQLSTEFGNRYIVLPNPVYGDWENAIYQYKALTMAQKDSAIKSQLKSY